MMDIVGGDGVSWIGLGAREMRLEAKRYLLPHS